MKTDTRERGNTGMSEDICSDESKALTTRRTSRRRRKEARNRVRRSQKTASLPQTKSKRFQKTE
jgi:hypothetical protein